MQGMSYSLRGEEKVGRTVRAACAEQRDTRGEKQAVLRAHRCAEGRLGEQQGPDTGRRCIVPSAKKA